MSHAEQIFVDAQKNVKNLESTPGDYPIEMALADEIGQLLYRVHCVSVVKGVGGIMKGQAFKDRFMEHVEEFFPKDLMQPLEHEVNKNVDDSAQESEDQESDQSNRHPYRTHK